jgi:F-type H+-transporting ATPase subunit c
MRLVIKFFIQLHFFVAENWTDALLLVFLRPSGFVRKTNGAVFRSIIMMIINTLILGKLIGAGLATISLAGAGVGIGIVFAGFLIALSRNPKDEKKLLSYALLGFALTEAIALFGLMVTFLILFGF